MEYASIFVFSAFETNPWPLILIDMGRPLLGMALSGAVLAAWRQRASGRARPTGAPPSNAS